MPAPNRSWPALSREYPNGRPVATDIEARAAGLCKVDMSGTIVYRHPVDAKEIVRLGQGTIVEWPPQTGGNFS